MTRLSGRVAMVMGAGSSGPGWGNGKAAAVLYAREGATVLSVDVDLAAAEETAAIIRGEGYRCEAIRADVAEAKDVEAVVHRCLELFGRIDILHYNVGLAIFGPTHELSETVWDRVLAVNLKGVFLACRAVLPVMMEQGRGVITNISSIAGVRWAGAPACSYSASKGAINMFTQALAVEYAPHGIRANVILPGLMDTPIIRNAYRNVVEDMDALLAKRHAICPPGKMGDAWDIARASVFLASDEAAYINGVLLPVDGGITVKSFEIQ